MQSARQKVILCIGDSWSVLGENVLRQHVHKHSKDVHVQGHGVSGSTASQWIHQTSSIQNYLRQHSNKQKIVWLSVGGNDITSRYMQGFNIDNGMKAIQEDIEKILDAIVSVDNDTKVVHFGYDFINIEPMLLAIVGKTLSDANNAILEFSNILTRLSNMEKYRGRFTHIPMTGLLQRAAGISGAPRLDMPSPAHFMMDPIHPNAKGFELFISKLYNEYLCTELDLPRPAITTTESSDNSGGSSVQQPHNNAWDQEIDGLLDSLLPHHHQPASNQYEEQLSMLDAMGFTDRVNNTRLLDVYKGDVDRVVASLLDS